jgi:hypothetical protein
MTALIPKYKATKNPAAIIIPLIVLNIYNSRTYAIGTIPIRIIPIWPATIRTPRLTIRTIRPRIIRPVIVPIVTIRTGGRIVIRHAISFTYTHYTINLPNKSTHSMG